MKVGLGYAFQIENFTEDTWDEPLDEFLTERGYFILENNDLYSVEAVENKNFTPKERAKKILLEFKDTCLSGRLSRLC